jgi:hypothetical protein
MFRCRELNPGRMGENHKCYRLHHSGYSYPSRPPTTSVILFGESIRWPIYI